MSKFLFLLEYTEYINSVSNFEDTKYTDEYIYKSFLKNTKDGKLLLKEGLIYSQPIDTTIRILKRKFEELIINKYDDGDISIQGMNEKLGKYLPLINNLGYFISSAFNGNDNIDFKYDDLPNLICDNIFIEPKYDYKMNNRRHRKGKSILIIRPNGEEIIIETMTDMEKKYNFSKHLIRKYRNRNLKIIESDLKENKFLLDCKIKTIENG